MSTVWKDLPGSPGYQVSSDGQVRVHRGSGGRILKQSKNSRSGYMTAHIRRVTKNVHSLVATTFLGPMPRGQEVNHIDRDRANNRSINLEYVTRQENMIHSYRRQLPKSSRLTPAKVREIRRLRPTMSLCALAAKFGVAKGTITFITTGKTWRWV